MTRSARSLLARIVRLAGDADHGLVLDSPRMEDVDALVEEGMIRTERRPLGLVAFPLGGAFHTPLPRPVGRPPGRMREVKVTLLLTEAEAAWVDAQRGEEERAPWLRGRALTPGP